MNVSDFERFRTIADEVGACLMVDMAHLPVWSRQSLIRPRRRARHRRQECGSR
ncbi:hypothetical protein [Acidomonas methanolica]|nr:hypothetical protein [Acidomonas methanolica]